MVWRRCDECGQRYPAQRSQCAWCGAAMPGKEQSDSELSKRRFKYFVAGVIVFAIVMTLLLSRVRGVW